MAKTPSLNQLTELQKRMAQFEKTIDSFTSSVNRLTESFNQNAANAQKIVDEQKKAEEEKADKSQSYIKSLREEKELQEKINKLKDNQANRTKEIETNLVGIVDSEKERKQIAKNIAQEEINQAKNTQKILRSNREQLTGLKDQFDLKEKYISALQKENELREEIDNLTKNQQDRVKQLSKELEDIVTDETKREQIAKNIAQEEIDQAKNVQKIAKLDAERLFMSKERLKSEEKLKNLQEKSKNLFSESLGFIDDISKTIEDIPVIGGVLSESLGLSKLKEELAASLSENIIGSFKKGMIDTATATEEVAGSTNSIESGMKGAGIATSGVLASLLLLAAAAAMVAKAFKLDEELTNLSREMGLTRDEAIEAHHAILDIAKTTKISGADAEALTKAYKELASIPGIKAIDNRDAVEAQVLMTKQYAMNEEQQAQIQLMSAASGQTAFQTLATTKSLVAEYNQLTGDSADYKDITHDIANISKATYATYKGNTKQLVLAVLQAKKLGLTLEDAAAISKSLLDIETSIESEMKANVLTGKHVNMNTARGLALQGKTAEAAAAAVEEIGSYEEFLNMAPYQQEALAAAAGMTVEQISKAGQIQKINASLTGKQIKSLSELSDVERERLVTSGDLSAEQSKQLAQEAQSISQQQKIADLINKIYAGMDLLVFGPLKFLMDAFDYIAPVVAGIATTIAVVMLPAIVQSTIAMGALAKQTITAAIAASTKALAEITGATASTFGLAAIGIAAGIATAAAAYYALKPTDPSKAGDIDSPASGKTIVSTKEGGLFSLSPNDDLAAAPGLSSFLSNGGRSTPMTQVNNSGIESLLIEQNKLLSSLIQATNQPVKINIGNKTIEEIDRISTLRKTYSTKVDNAYGTFG